MNIKLKPCPFCGVLPRAPEEDDSFYVADHKPNCILAQQMYNILLCGDADIAKWNSRYGSRRCDKCYYSFERPCGLFCNEWSMTVSEEFFCADFEEKYEEEYSDD